MDAAAYLAERAELVTRRLDELMPPADEPPQSLHAAMRHLVFPGGKRLRPGLALAGAEALGAPAELALPAAAAVELVHTYSLIHDDLPCMDDDRERRGRPTVHVLFGEAVALLAGDALLALAFQAASAPTELPARRVVRVLRELSLAAGSRQLVGGQVDDLAWSAGAGGAAQVESVHARKSAALLAASVVCGAALAGADDERLERLRRFGLAMGIGFQIADDLLDADEDSGCSLLRVAGPEAARARAEELLAAALDQIEDLGERAEPLRELARFAVRRDA